MIDLHYKTFFNYIIKIDKEYTLIRIEKSYEKIYLLYYSNNTLREFTCNSFSYSNNEICFNNNIISDNKIKIDILNINIEMNFKNIKNKKYNNISYGNFFGLVNDVKSVGVIYLDVEIFKNEPYEYIKMISINEKIENDLISISTYCTINKIESVVYTNINEIIKENKYIKIKNSYNKILFKSYNYIYNLKYQFQSTSTFKRNCKVGICSYDFFIKKNLSKPFINYNNKKGVFLYYKI